jgi:signal transduction histidine kinase/CheY-like chemotaxis protein
MMRDTALAAALAPEYLSTAGIVSLLSVLVLVGLFYYLNRYTGRGYFSIWTLGWGFYAGWLALGLGPENIQTHPLPLMLKHWCVGMSAALLFWGSAQFLRLNPQPRLFFLFIGFLLTWSYVGAYYLKDPLQVRVPIFGTIGLASLVTSFCFYRVRKHREFIGAGLLCFGFGLWGAYLVVLPLLLGSSQSVGTGFLIAAVLQLFIAVSMIILVLEEARAATDHVLNRLRTYGFESPLAMGLSAGDEVQYSGLFDRSALNQKLRAAYDDLHQAQARNLQQERLQALSQMSRGLAHDINNALTPILGYANLMLSSQRDLPEHMLRYVRGIKTAGEKISQSVACIRDFYRKSGGTATLAQVDVNRLIAEMLEAPLTDGKLVEVRTDQDAQLPRIVAQKTEIRDALSRLVQNGLEAMPEGGRLVIRTRMRRGGFARPGTAPADAVEVEVADTGVGMDEETRKRCLEPFFTTKNQQGAKGLGLSLVFGVMERHGGRVEIESQPGRGTTARLVFSAPKAAAAEPPPAPTAEPPSALRILCVDDEPAVLDVLRIMFRNNGHRVDIAGEGEDALKVFRDAAAAREPFDVVVSDMAMPRMDGRQLAKLIKQGSPDTPVIMLTGWGDIMKVEEIQPENIDAVLGKPPEPKELFETVRRLAIKHRKAGG